MFSLIITIICIALVAALAFAVYVINKASRQLDKAAQRLIDEGPVKANVVPRVVVSTDQLREALKKDPGFKLDIVDIAIRNRERRSDRWPQA